MENPIVIKGVKSYDKLKQKQQEYIDKRYGNYYITGNTFTMDDKDHVIHYFLLENSEGEKAIIFFDVSDICKVSRKSKNKELAEIIKVLESFKYS